MGHHRWFPHQFQSLLNLGSINTVLHHLVSCVFSSWYHHPRRTFAKVDFWRFSDFCCFWPTKACCVNWCYVFLGYPENTKYPFHKNCVSSSWYRIIWKLAYLGVKMTSFIQKHKLVVKVAYFGVAKFSISFKGIKSSGKLSISVNENHVREKMLHFDLHQPGNCVSRQWHSFSLLTKKM